jgi:hypothetical protein
MTNLQQGAVLIAFSAGIVLMGDNITLAQNPQKLVRGKWEKMSGYALPNPRDLTNREKAALKLLDGVTFIHDYKFSSTTLDDGSTIPAKPNPTKQEVEDIIFSKVKAKGIGDGFESAIRALAVRNPNRITLKVQTEANWADVENALGIKETLKPTGGSDVSYRGPDGKPVRFKVQWVGTPGWLSFGVDSGKVRFIQAKWEEILIVLPNPNYIAAEDVDGGRSDPDPAKALRPRKARPANAPPATVETLQKLGKVVDVKVVPYPAKKETDAMRKVAADLVGKPIYPDVVDAARKFKDQGREVLDLFVTPSATMTFDQMTDILPDQRILFTDARTFPGLTLKWYTYQWVDFGLADGQVKKIRIHVQILPKTIDR